jgi:cysteine desulfurase
MGSGERDLPVTGDGLLDRVALEKAVASGPALVAVQHVNNETGVTQPISEIAELVTGAGSLLLADCAQSAGKLPLPSADFIAVSAHKFGGPPGIGALLVREPVTLEPSGGQERGYRRGTQDAPAAAGMAAALTCGAFRRAMLRLAELRSRLDEGVRSVGGAVIAQDSPRIPNIGAVALPGSASASLLVQFDLAGLAVSAGAACSSGTMKESRVLRAMGVDSAIASSAIRVSFGPQTSADDVEAFLAVFRDIAERREAA